jgi:ATP-dependent Lhr-like helicase
MLHVDFPRARDIYRQMREGEMEVAAFRSEDKPTPLAFHILNKHVDVPELIAPETVERDTIERLRFSLDNMTVDLLCFECGQVSQAETVKKLPAKPQCISCGSALLAVSTWSSDYLSRILERKRTAESLEDDERNSLSKARRSADLVLSYGRRAIVAQCVYGIGPQTASRILARMHDDDKSFYKDLLEAKLKFITTRQFWDRP